MKRERKIAPFYLFLKKMILFIISLCIFIESIKTATAPMPCTAYANSDPPGTVIEFSERKKFEIRKFNLLVYLVGFLWKNKRMHWSECTKFISKRYNWLWIGTCRCAMLHCKTLPNFRQWRQRSVSTNRSLLWYTLWF